MIVDVRGGNSQNMGAELMLRAVTSRLGQDHELTAPPVRIAFEVACDLRLRRTLPVHRAPRASGWASDRVPRRIRERFAVVAESDIGGTVNIAGYAYGDPFPARNARLEGQRTAMRAKREAPTILLPQALGPFTSREHRDGGRRLLAAASRVYARDRRSLEHAMDLVPACDVRVAPDFTIGLEAHLGIETPSSPFVAIVPNMKLVEMGRMSRDDYFGTLVGAARAAERMDLLPVIVVHETKDAAIGRDLAAVIGRGIVSDGNPLRLKAFLGAAEAVVASRFHAVVGALSHAVPTVVVGWSHKYGELLHDFGVPDWVPEAGEDAGDALVRIVSDRDGVATVAARKADLVRESDLMWADVRSILGGH